MAILNNLIVNGSSRFLNKAWFNDVSIGGEATLAALTASSLTSTGTLTVSGDSTLTGSVSAGQITSTGKIYSNGFGKDSTMTVYPCGNNELNFGGTGGLGSGNSIYIGYRAVDSKAIPSKFVFGGSTGTANLTAGSATLSGALSAGNTTLTKLSAGNIDVKGVLRSEQWDIQNVTQLFNDFAVSPSFKLSSAATIVVAKPNSTTVTLTIKDTTSINSDSIGGAVWANNSQIKVSGTLNGVVLGTCTGVTTAKMNTTANTLALSFTVASGDPLASVAAGTYTASAGTVKEFFCMLYSVGDYPVGIRLTSYGTNKDSEIDIYGGTAGSLSHNYWAPVVRIGKLDGMKDASGNQIKINNVAPTGWGLYTSNGYFSGTIVSSSGLIGNWKLDSNSLSIGTWGENNSALLSTGTTGSKSIGGSDTLSGWVFTAGTNFGVTKAGALYANSAHISGEVTATSGSIGGWSIGSDTSKSLYYENSTPGATTSNLVFSKSSAANTNAIAGSSTGLNWMISAGRSFGVTTAGALYSNSGYIGGWKIQANNLSMGTWGSNNSAMLCTGTSDAKSIGGSDSINGWVFTAGANFGVTKTGALYANSATIDGDIIADNLTINEGATIGGGGAKDILNSELVIGVRNLAIDSTSSEGYLTANASIGSQDESLGSANDTQKERTTDYIAIEEGETYTMQFWATIPNGYYYWCAWRIYDADRNCLTSRASRNGSAVSEDTSWHYEDSITMPTGAAFIRLSMRTYEDGRWKFEHGDKATDWIPAPEDTDTNISSTVENSSAALSDRIDGIDDVLNGGENNDEGIITQIENINATLTPLETDFRVTLNDMESFMKFKDYDGSPNLVLGSVDSDYNVVITNTRMAFRDQTSVVAYIDQNGLYVQEYLSFGNFQFYQRNNGHFTLKFIGGGDE